MKIGGEDAEEEEMYESVDRERGDTQREEIFNYILPQAPSENGGRGCRDKQYGGGEGSDEEDGMYVAPDEIHSPTKSSGGGRGYYSAGGNDVTAAAEPGAGDDAGGDDDTYYVLPSEIHAPPQQQKQQQQQQQQENSQVADTEETYSIVNI